MKHMILHFYPTITKKISAISAHIQSVHDIPDDDNLPTMSTFAAKLKNAALCMDAAIAHIDEAAYTILKNPSHALNLTAFKDGPASAEIPLPSKYTCRLKTIFSDVIQRIHNTRPIIETVETQEHRFETYITIGNFTRRYYGCHEKNAVGAEAAAIFYSLKHVTNVLGYRIIDLNYPTLATMVADLNRWNAEINMLQLPAMFMMNQTNQMYDEITTAYEPLHMLDFYIPAWEHIVRSTSEALDMVNNYWSDIDYLYHKCDEHKERYISTRVNTYSPSRSYYHWGRANRPRLTSTSAYL